MGWGPKDDVAVDVFRRQIAIQCGFGIRAGTELLASAGKLQSVESLAESIALRDSVWASAQSLLNASANASKLLWGARTIKYPAGREQLRDMLGVGLADAQAAPRLVLWDSVRRLRNRNEHIDEWLEKVIGKMPAIDFVDRNISDYDLGDPELRLRHLDTRTMTLTCTGVAVVVGDLIAELARMRALADPPRGS